MKKILHLLSLAFVLIATQQSANAEDIDLFLGVPATAAATPNILFIIDNTANWSTPVSSTTRFDQEITAIANVLSKSSMVNSDGSAKVNIGIALFAESPRKGGYIRAAIRPFTSTGDNTQLLYKNLVNSFDKNNDKGANALYGYSMAEAYRYFTGDQAYIGAAEPKRDYHNNTTGTSQSKAIYALSPDSANAFTDSTRTSYNKPSTVAGCAKNFIIFISNGPIDNSDKDDTSPQCLKSDGSVNNLTACTAKQLLTLASGNTSAISISPSDEQNSMADEWARFMRSSNLAVKTYTIDVGPTSNVQGRAHSALLQSMADVSNAQRFLVNSVDTTEIEKAIDAAVAQILATNSVFASVSLPASASANTESTFLNQVFIGMFRPDGSAKPRWQGNIKQYKLGLINNQVKLVYDPVSDSDTNSGNDLSAINSNTGFITQCARSYWTSPTVDTYWDYTGSFFKSTNETGCSGYSLFSNYPDGQFVEKGGQAQTLRSSTARVMKTCSSATCSSLVTFNGTNVSQTDLGASSTTEAAQLISWAQGLDVDDENGNSITSSTTPSEMRPSAHGDVVHSRPVVINYGTNEVVVYYSGNDGVLRAINGNRSASITKGSSTYSSGKEIWSFMPPEFFPNIKRIRDNSTLISYPGSLVTGALPKPYGMDGPLSAYQGTISSSGSAKVFLYGAMRRGGRTLYAFDVTDESTPSLKWRVGCPNLTNDTNCTSSLSGIGQTWAPPSVIKTPGYGSGFSPMLIMGGGYDTCEDYDSGTKNNNCTSTKGNHIYVLDANSGSVLKTFDTDRAVIGGITIVPDSSGYASYGYAADLGGNIYRISGSGGSNPIGSDAPGNWQITKIASLGCASTSNCDANRKFMFAPDVVKDSSGIYYLLIGSGDREKPLYSYSVTQTVQNYMFMIKDNPVSSTWLSDESTTCGSSVICLNSLTEITSTLSPPSTISDKGWRLTLTHTTSSGVTTNEQVVTSALTVANVVTFSTSIPQLPVTGSCSSGLGNARVYNVNYKNAQTVSKNADGSFVAYQDIAGDGLPPSPVAGKVILDDGSTVPFIIGASPDSPLEGGTPGSTSSWTQPKQRVYWYIEQ